MGLIASTKLAILKELRDGPAHGYAIAKRNDISTGAVYTHLDDLEQEGMIQVARVEADGRQKKHYELTENGELLLTALGED